MPETGDTMSNVLIVGCGYVGKRIAKLALTEGSDVFALVRNGEKAAELEQSGIHALCGNFDEPDRLPELPTRDAVVHYLVPPIGGGSIDPRVRLFAASIAPGNEPRILVYMSTSGVYGDCRGRTIDEETPVNAQTTRARRRLDAEEYLLSWGRNRNVPIVILRVSGIYGPERVPIAQIESGNPIIREAESPLSNRIHVDDLAVVCMAAAVKGEAGEIFNVSDGNCTTMTSYFNAVADEFGLMRPSQVSREQAPRLMNPLILSYFSESRCLDNNKMLERLGITLKYPTLTEGLKGCRGAE